MPLEYNMSRRGVFFLFAIFAISFAIALILNAPCLFFDWDGSSWAVAMSTFQKYSSSFSISQIDPTQAMLDLNYQAYRGGLPQLIFNAAPGSLQAKGVVLFLAYSLMLVFSCYALARAAGFSRLISVTGCMTYPLLAMPVFSDNAVIGSAFSLNPNFSYLVASSIASIAAFWRIKTLASWHGLLLTLIVFLILFGAAWTLILHSFDIAEIVFVFGVMSLFATTNSRERVSKLGAALIILLALYGFGFLDYLLAVAENAAFRHFQELASTGAIKLSGAPLNDLITTFRLQLTFPARLLICGGLAASLFYILTPSLRSIRAFACGFLGILLLYFVGTSVSEVLWPTLTGTPYKGPVFYWLSYHFLPVACLLIVASTIDLSELAVSLSQKYKPRVVTGAMPHFFTGASIARRWILKQWPRVMPGTPSHFRTYLSRFRLWFMSRYISLWKFSGKGLVFYIFLIAALALAILPAVLGFKNNPGASAHRCVRPYFWPLVTCH